MWPKADKIMIRFQITSAFGLSFSKTTMWPKVDVFYYFHSPARSR